MKKNIFVLLTVLCTLTLGCSYLEENPTTSLSEAIVYDTEALLEAGMEGCYGTLVASQNSYMGRMTEYLHSGSALIHWKGQRTTNDWLDCLKLAKYSTGSIIYNHFGTFYTCINRCNKLIKGLDSSPVDEQYKKEIEAEARFLRAHQYFTLARLYGAVPMPLTPTEDPTNMSLPRTPVGEVYDQIIKDFTFAWENMRDSADQLRKTSNYNRPGRWAALASRATVYLHIGSLLSSPDDNFWKPEHAPSFKYVESAADAFEKALADSKKVIDEGPYSLAEHFADLFKWKDVQDFRSPERIFTLQSASGVTEGNMLCLYTLTQCPDGTLCTQSLTNYGRMRPSRWFFQEWCSRYGGVKGSGVSANIYVSCTDPRFDASILHSKVVNNATRGETSIYPKVTAATDAVKAFPYFNKYVDPNFNNNVGNVDLYYIRLAEMYLTAAEAEASLCETEGDEHWKNAVGYVNVLLERARKRPDGTVSAQPANWPETADDSRFSSKEKLIDEIIWEREFEMCCENHEWFDTHRRGATFLRDHIAIPMNDHLARSEQRWEVKEGEDNMFTLNYNSAVYPTDVEDLRKSLLCAFPSFEINLNSAISNEDQNDYYWQ